MATPLSCLITDWAYDGDAFRDWLVPRGIRAVIPRAPGTWILSPAPYQRATRLNAASAGSRGVGAWPPATPHTPIVS